MNLTILLLAALVPIVTGFIWYHPKIAGTAWMKSAGIDPSRLKTGGMAGILFFALLFSVMLSLILHSVVIHQQHVYSMVMNAPGFGEEGSEVMTDLNAFLAKYGGEFRSFGHGVFHGVLAALFFALPVFGMNALFERKGFRYILIHTVYWILTLGLMGGIICQWS